MKLLDLIPTLLVGLLIILAFVLSLAYMQPNPTITDTIGYVQASRQLAEGKGLAYFDPHNRDGHSFYTLYAFKVMRPDNPNPYFSYPPGTAILAAALAKLLGRSAAMPVFSALMAALAIASISCLGTLLHHRWSGFWAALTLFSLPVFLTFSTDAWSEVPSTAFLLLGLVLYMLSSRQPRKDLAASCLGILSAITIGATFFFRFSNITVLPALFLLAGMSTSWKGLWQRRSIAWFGSLGLSVIAVLLYNTQIYGGPLTTGYSPIHGWYDKPPFSFQYALGSSFIDGYSIPAIGKALLTEFRWLLIFTPFAFLTKQFKLTCWLLIFAFCLLAPYMVYAFAATGINARFVIPAWSGMSLLIGAGIMTTGSLLPNTTIRWLLGISLAFVMLYSFPAVFEQLASRNLNAEAAIMQATQIANQTETNAVILSYGYNDLLAVYGERSTLTYRHMTPYDRVTGVYHYAEFEGLLIEEVTGLLRANTPVYYLLDSQPPLLDSYAILERYFVMELVVNTPIPLFRLQLPPP